MSVAGTKAMLCPRARAIQESVTVWKLLWSWKRKQHAQFMRL